MTPRTATKFFSLLLSCVALGSDTQGTHKEQKLLFVRHARGRKLESGVQKNRSIKPKIKWKAKGLPDVWQGQHQVLEVQQALSLRRDCFQSLGAPRLHRTGSKPASHWNKKRRDRMVTPFFCVLLYAAGTALATL